MDNTMSFHQYLDYTKNRMLNTVKKDEKGCWIWQGYKCEPKKMYGLTSSKLDGKKRKILAHRLSYRLWKGEIHNNLQVLHYCDVPLCVNPDHLHLGTAQDNINEMRERKREKKGLGEKNRHAKLKNEDVLKIRELSSNGKSNSELCKIFGLRSSTMSYIVRKITWKHI